VQKKSMTVLLFLLFALLPVIPIVTSYSELRNSVILVQPVLWEKDQTIQVQLPEMASFLYEFRMESDDSKWEPVLSAKWKLSAGDEVLAESPTEGLDWNIVRPFLEFKNTESVSRAKTLELVFLNSNPKKQEVRLKISKDRGQILEKHTRLFVILLALSLGLTLLIWKPFFTADTRES
jgi:hypothetical protein